MKLQLHDFLVNCNCFLGVNNICSHTHMGCGLYSKLLWRKINNE